MTSLSQSMAENELRNPNSPYYMAGPTVMDEIRGYMNGVSYGSRYSYPVRRNMYIGQPVQDKFESLAKATYGRKSENIFKATVAGATTILIALAARKIPGVKPAVKYTGQALGFCGKVLAFPFKLLWKAIK